jgi:RNA polymerase sigma-70 factor (family 1)
MDNTCSEHIFKTFFEKHAKALRNYLYYKFGNYDTSEDLTQEAFIKLWQNCKDVPLEKAKSYIYTIANNSFLNVKNHEKVVLNFEKQTIKNEKDYESPHYLIEEQEFENKLTTALNNLNETQRVAFLMNRIDGKKYSEIAQELGISVKAVEKRIHIALVELRKNIDNIR